MNGLDIFPGLIVRILINLQVYFQSVLWIDAIYIQMAAKKRIIRPCFILKSRVAEPEPKNYEVPAPAPGEL